MRHVWCGNPRLAASLRRASEQRQRQAGRDALAALFAEIMGGVVITVVEEDDAR